MTSAIEMTPSLTGNSWVDALSVIAVAAAALAAVRTWIYKPVMEVLDRARDRDRALFGIPADIVKGLMAVPGALQRIAIIEAEVTHNGGASLKDALRRVEVTGEETRAELAARGPLIQGIRDALDEHIVQTTTASDEWLKWRTEVDGFMSLKGPIG